MLAIYKYIKPQKGVLLFFSALEEIQNGLQRVSERVVPRMADKPGGGRDVVGC